METEELEYIKEGNVEDKLYFIFMTTTGEYRAVEAEKIHYRDISPGQKFKARVKRRGCSGREIEELFKS